MLEPVVTLQPGVRQTHRQTNMTKRKEMNGNWPDGSVGNGARRCQACKPELISGTHVVERENKFPEVL